jgi:glycosyltransferase involved in cell wall biosynthesis
MIHLVKRVCEGVESDKALIQRFARQIDASGVDYLLPNLGIFAPHVAAAVRQTERKVGFSVTFQGYELYSRYAREVGLEKQLFERFRDAVEESNTPAIAVSEDYRQRVHADIGVPLDNIVVIPPGMPEEKPLEDSKMNALLAAELPDFRPELPMVSYVGRQDSEKGIDLLLYAARMLHNRGVKFQLAICGGTAFGGEYAVAIRNMADQLEIPVIFHGYMSSELRTAIFQASHCTVYPSIHREPFGMVPVESMMLGTPAVVADTGGVSELVQDGEKRGGLTFRSWDSADLADKLQTILEDKALYKELKSSAREVGGRYSVARLADRTLELIREAQ